MAQRGSHASQRRNHGGVIRVPTFRADRGASAAVAKHSADLRGVVLGSLSRAGLPYAYKHQNGRAGTATSSSPGQHRFA